MVRTGNCAIYNASAIQNCHFETNEKALLAVRMKLFSRQNDESPAYIVIVAAVC